MKFSARQILASATGAVLAALIASTFGVTGTIVGVAIGSCVATMGTALVAQSIERGHEAVKQVVVRAPDTSLLRRLGGTGASGTSNATVHHELAPAEAVAASSGGGAAGSARAVDEETATMESPVTGEGDTHRLEISAVADAPATERLEAATLPVAAANRAGDHGRRFTWPAIAGTAAVVFLLALLFVTAVELISGKPLSSIFGNHGSGPSVQQIFVPSSPGPAPTTTTVPPATTTTPSTGASNTTSSTTTTTAPPSGGSTTTTGVGSTSTTTTAPGATTTAPG